MSDNSIEKLAKATARRASAVNSGTIVFTAIIAVSALLSAIFFWRHSSQVFAGLPVLLATVFGLVIGLLPSEGAFFGWKAVRKANEDKMTGQQMTASDIGLWAGVAFAVGNIVAVFITSFPEVPQAIRDLADWMVFIALLLPIPTQFICYALFVMGDAEVQEGHRKSVLNAARARAMHLAELARIGAVMNAAEAKLQAELPAYGESAAAEEVARLLAGTSQIYLPAPTVVNSTHDTSAAPAVPAPGQAAAPRLHPDDIAAIAAALAASTPPPLPTPVPHPNGQEATGNGVPPRP